jgi:hypothetical protein
MLMLEIKNDLLIDIFVLQIMLALLINNRGGDAALWEGRSSRQGSSWLLLV